MRHITLLTIAITIVLVSSLTTMAGKHTLMTYNVRNGLGLDDTVSIERVADVIIGQHPDIVALQELDSATIRSGGKYVLGELSRLTGMYACYAPAIDYDGGSYGIGILCQSRPLSVQRLPLPGEEEKRTLIVVEMPGYHFACTHLSLTEQDRMRSLNTLREVGAQASKPFVIAGDFNACPDSDFIREMLEDFTPLTDITVATFPADNPIETIDYIMIYNPTRDCRFDTQSEVIPEPVASDHRPVVSFATFPDTSRTSLPDGSNGR